MPTLDDHIRAAFDARTAPADEPGPDPRQVYRQAVADSTPTTRRRGWVIAVAAVLVAAALVAVGIIATIDGDSDGSRVITEPPEEDTAEDDSSPSTTIRRPGAAVMGTPIELEAARQIKATDEAVWVSNDLRGSVTRLDPDTGETTAIVDLGFPVSDLGTGDGSVWVSHGPEGFVTRVDARTAQIVDTYDLGSSVDRVDYGAGAIWALDREAATLTRLDPATGEQTVLQIEDVSFPAQVEVMQDGVWFPTNEAVVHIDVSDNSFTVIDVGGPITGLDADHGSVWVAGPTIGAVRIDPATDEIIATVDTQLLAFAPNIGPRHAWIATATGCSQADTCTIAIVRIDPATNQIIEEIPLPQLDSLAGIWVAHDTVYIPDGQGTITPIHVEGGP